MTAALVTLGLLALLAPRPANRGAAVAIAALWFLGTPLLDLAAHGPWPAAAAFLLAAVTCRIPRRLAAAGAGLALATGIALAQPLTLAPDRMLAGAFVVPDGLFVRSPLLWVALLGGFLAGRAPAPQAVAAALALAAAAAASSSALQGVALALLFAGFVTAVDALAAALRRRPAHAVAALGLALTLWNLLSMETYRRGLVPRDDTVAFADLAGHNAAVLRSFVGTPLAFPANAWFAARHDLASARWDRLAEAFVFEPWPGLGNEIVLAAPGPEVDGLLDGGWGSRVPCPPLSCRNLGAEAVVYFQLRRATRLVLAIDARGPGAIAVALDGHELGPWALGDALARLTLRLPERLPAGLRRLTLRPLGGARPRVARVVFVTEER